VFAIFFHPKQKSQPQDQDLQTTQHPYLFNVISIHTLLSQSGGAFSKSAFAKSEESSRLGDLEQSRKELRVGVVSGGALSAHAHTQHTNSSSLRSSASKPCI